MIKVGIGESTGSALELCIKNVAADLWPPPAYLAVDAIPHSHVFHFQVLECSVARRLTMLLLASLRASGTVRLYVETASVRER